MRATFALCYIHDGWRKMTMVVLNSTSASANMSQRKPMSIYGDTNVDI